MIKDTSVVGEKEKQECTALIMTTSEYAAPSWKMYVDGSVSWSKSGQRIILVCPDGYRYEYALKFLFRALNNATEYEALIGGLQLARDIGVSRLEEFDDSQLVVNQMSGLFEVNEQHMSSYQTLAKALMQQFDSVVITQIPRSKNENADTPKP